MRYTRAGDEVTLKMTVDDFDNLLRAIGFAAGAASIQPDAEMFWRFLSLANELNTGNPNYAPYEIPKEFERRSMR